MANRLNTQVFEAQLPAGEEVISDEPTDAVEGYLRLLQRWEALSDRQAAYDKELQALNAQGDQLAADWEALSTQHRACLHALERCETPLADAIRQTWTLCRQQLAGVIAQHESQRAQYGGKFLPGEIQALARTPKLHPRGEGTATADKE